MNMRKMRQMLAGILAAAVMAGAGAFPAAAEGAAERESVYPKIDYSAIAVTTEAHHQGSDGSSNSNAAVDGVTGQTSGAYKWYLSGDKLKGAYLTIILPQKYKIDKLVLYSGYTSRDPAVVNTEANKPNNTAEIAYHYRFDYETEDGSFAPVPGAERSKAFDGLTAADREATLEFDEVETQKIRFVVLPDQYNFRLREIALYGIPASPEPGAPPLVTLDEVPDAEAGSDVTLRAGVVENGNSINRVDFYNGGTLLGAGTLVGNKYEYVLRNAAGSYNITAMVIYNDSGETVSDPVIFTAGFAELGVNAARGKPAEASYFNAGNGGPSCLTDGIKDKSTGTAVLFADQNKTRDVTLSIDLEGQYEVDKVVLYHGMGTPLSQTLNSFTLQYSPEAGTVTDADYVTLRTVTGAAANPWIIALDTPVTAGHIRLISNIENSGTNMFRVREIEVYGTEAVRVPAVTVRQAGGAAEGDTVTLQADVAANGSVVGSVEFFDGSTLLGRASGEDGVYHYAWNNVPAGKHSITARVSYGENGDAVTSEPMVFTAAPRPVPEVSIEPIGNVTAGDTVTLRAVVNDKGYAIVKVEFFDGTKSLGEAGNVDGGFQLVWNDVPEGGHSVTARASYDEDGKTVTSAPLTFTAAAAPLPPPEVVMDPVSGVTEGDTLTLRAEVKACGNAITSVEFLDRENSLVGTAVLLDGWYQYNWVNVPAGTHSITARVTYDLTKTVTSAAVTFTAVQRPAPVVVIEPVTDMTAGESVTLRAAVTDNGNRIAGVEFFDGTVSLGQGTEAAGGYQLVWNTVPEGEHSVTARVTYGENGQTVTSAAAKFQAAEKTPGPVRENTALGADVVSNIEDSGNSSAASLVDGVTNKTSGTDKWFADKKQTMDAWVNLALKERSMVETIRIYSGYSNSQPTTKDKLTDFEIWYSDAVTADPAAMTDYTLAKAVSGAPLGLTEVVLDAPVAARHIKIISKVENNRVDPQKSDGVRVREIEAMGTIIAGAFPNAVIDAVTGVIAGDDVLLSAAVDPAGNEISAVEFLDNGVLLGAGVAAGEKFQYTIANVAPGPHSITVRLIYGGTQQMTFGPMRFTAAANEGLFGIVITSPAEDTAVQTGQTIVISAAVSDRSQQLREVALLLNGRVLKSFAPSADGNYETTGRVRAGRNTAEVQATAADGSIQSKSVTFNADFGKIQYDRTFTAAASVKGSDSGSTPDALIDGKSTGDTGSNKWYLNAEASAESWASISFPGEYRIDRIVLTSGYISRNPSIVNTEDNRPDNTAEMPFHYRFEYKDRECIWTPIPGAVFDKPFTSLTEEDKVVTFAFDEISAAGIRFVCLEKGYGYPYRLREIELYGTMANKPPVITLAEPGNGGLIMEGASLELSAEILDEENDVREVHLYVDGVQTAAEVRQDGTAFTVTLASDGLSRGEHSVYLTAADGYGEAGTSNTVKVTVADETAILRVLEQSSRANIEENLQFAARQLGIDLSRYLALARTRQEKVLLALLGQTFASKSALQSALDKAVAEAGSESGGSRPSGGGTAGSSSHAAPAGSGGVAPVQTETPGTAEETGFSDLGQAEWAREAVNALAKTGVITGVGENRFAPLDQVTRGQFAKILIGALDMLQTDAAAAFSDVPQSDEFYPYIASAREIGIVQGRGDGTFGTEEPITREDLAVMLVRAADAAGIALLDTVPEQVFLDAGEVSEYAAGAVRQVQKAGIMTGAGDGRFAPQETSSRAMAAKVVYLLTRAA